LPGIRKGIESSDSRSLNEMDKIWLLESGKELKVNDNTAAALFNSSSTGIRKGIEREAERGAGRQ